MSNRTWAIYLRVSTRHQAKEGFSLQDQRDRLITYAAERGWSYQVFEDAGECHGLLLDYMNGAAVPAREFGSSLRELKAVARQEMRARGDEKCRTERSQKS